MKRRRGTKTVAKAVIDAKMKVLRIPAEHWNLFCLLLKIEGICRLKSATQSTVCNLFDGTYIGFPWTDLFLCKY